MEAGELTVTGAERRSSLCTRSPCLLQSCAHLLCTRSCIGLSSWSVCASSRHLCVRATFLCHPSDCHRNATPPMPPLLNASSVFHVLAMFMHSPPLPFVPPLSWKHDCPLPVHAGSLPDHHLDNCSWHMRLVDAGCRLLLTQRGTGAQEARLETL